MMALETRNLTALVKEQLKYSIQTRRLEEGKGKLQVQFEDPQKFELRPDEVEKAEHKRELNRLAAQRFRQRQRSRENELLKKNQNLQSENTRLGTEIHTLQIDRDRLQQDLKKMLTEAKTKYLVMPKFSEIEKQNANLPAIIDDFISTRDDVMSTRSQEVPDIDNKTVQQNNKIIEATMVALETGELTPLLKKYSIQTRHLADGKGELQVVFVDAKNSELRPDEVEKVERRRELNRLAAQRCRQRQMSRENELLKKNQKLQRENTRLRSEIHTLQTERDQLQQALDDHLFKTTIAIL